MELRIDNATLIVTTKPCSVAFNDAANVGVASEEVTLANVAGNLTNLLVFAENYNVTDILKTSKAACPCKRASLHGKNSWSALRKNSAASEGFCTCTTNKPLATPTNAGNPLYLKQRSATRKRSFETQVNCLGHRHIALELGNPHRVSFRALHYEQASTWKPGQRLQVGGS